LPILLNPPKTSRISPLGAALLVAAGLLALGCRSDQVMHYRVPKGSAEASGPRPAMPPQPMGARTGEMPGGMPGGAPEVPPPPAPEHGLKWTLPKGWTQEPGSGMRFATLKAPVEGKLETSVVVLPGEAGGELANVNRWRGQIGLGNLDEAALAKGRTTLKTKAGVLNIYDFTGEGQAKSRMVAGYIRTTDGNTWFLKMTGDASPVAKAKPEFLNLLGSVRLD